VGKALTSKLKKKMGFTSPFVKAASTLRIGVNALLGLLFVAVADF
jgi:hypothetical protein